MPGSKGSPVVLLLQNPDDCTMYAEFLRHHGVEPLCPADPIDALALAPQADIIITELMVPTVADGVQFIQQLRTNVHTRHIRIVVVTSWAWQTERLRAQDGGCDVFLTKPCLPDVVLQEIQNVLAGPKLRAVHSRSANASDTRQRKTRRTS